MESVPDGRNATLNVCFVGTRRGQHQKSVGHLIVTIDGVHGVSLTLSLSLHRTLMNRKLPDIENVIAVW